MTSNLAEVVVFPAIGIPVNPEHLCVFQDAEALTWHNGPTLRTGLLRDLRLVQLDGTCHRVIDVRKRRLKGGWFGWHPWHGLMWELDVRGVREGILTYAECRHLVLERLRAAPSGLRRAEIARAVRRAKTMAELIASLPERERLP